MLISRLIKTNKSFSFFCSKSNFSKKKESLKKNQKSYNLKGIDESKLPEHLRKIYNVKKQAINMEVVSQSETAMSEVRQKIIQQRKDLEDQDPFRKKIRESQGNVLWKSIRLMDPIQKTIAGLTVGNVTIAGVLSAYSMKYLGIFCTMAMYPSMLAVGSLILGTNLGYLIVRQSLQLHTSQNNLKDFDLTEAPISYYIQSLLISLQLWFLSITRHKLSELPIFNDISPQVISSLAGIAAFSLVAHAYSQQRSFPKSNNSISSLSFKCFALLILVFFNLITKYGDQQQFIEGKKKYQQLWVKERPKVIVGQKINQ